MKKKILVIDDDQKLNDLLKDYLAKFGFDVETVEHPHDGLSKIKHQQIDLIILDVGIPKIDGFKVCRVLKKQGNTKHIPIILLTGLDKTGDVDKGFLCGADDYMIKPVDWNRLKSKIESILKI